MLRLIRHGNKVFLLVVQAAYRLGCVLAMDMTKTVAEAAVFILCQRRAIFPGRRQPSIVATGELNFRVRNGNGWTLTVIGTDYRRR